MHSIYSKPAKSVTAPVPAHELDAACATKFAKDGAVKLNSVFTTTQLALLAAGVEKTMQTSGPYTRVQSDPDDPGLFFSDYWASDRVPELRRSVDESPAAQVAAQVMGSKRIRFFFDAVWVKEPGTRKVSAWHQDQPYYCLSGRQVCIMWIPLDPVSSDVSLQCVRGSHAWQRQFEPVRFKDGGDFARVTESGIDYEPMPDVDDDSCFERMAWSLDPGDCLVFHGMTIHGAPGNDSSTRRRAVAFTWLGDDVRYHRRPGEMEPHREHFDDLQDGDELPEQDFPTVWSKQETLA